MKTYPKLFAFLLLAGLTVAASTLSFARRSVTGGEITISHERNGEHMIERFTKILAETEYPLTEEQITLLQNIEFGPGSRQAVRDILTEEQHAILAESKPEQRDGRGDNGPKGFRPEGMNREARIEHIGHILEDAGQALTPEQLEQLSALEPGQESREKVHAILTEEQAAVLHENRPDRPEGEGDHDSRMKGGRHGMVIGKILEDAGQPLSDDQKQLLGALDPGKGIREKVDSILTDEQKKVLEDNKENTLQRGRMHRGRLGSPEMIFEVLEDAGQPLTESQKTAINELERGEGHREKLMEILTDDQKEALKAAAKEHRGRGRAKDRSGSFQSLQPKHSDGQQNEDPKSTLALHKNYPNPFNPVTTIRFETQEASHVTLDIYNIDGQRVKTLVDHFVSAGPHSVVWNGTNDNGQQVSAGHYFYTLKNGTSMETQKMVFMK